MCNQLLLHCVIALEIGLTVKIFRNAEREYHQMAARRLVSDSDKGTELIDQV